MDLDDTTIININNNKVNSFEDLLYEKNKLIEELQYYIPELNAKHEKEDMEKDIKVKSAYT
jgi:hypothetical protein